MLEFFCWALRSYVWLLCRAQSCIMQAVERRHRERKCITECWAQGFGSPPSIHSYMCTLTHTLTHTQLRAYRFFQQHSGPPPRVTLSFCYVSSSAVGQAWLGHACVTESMLYCVCVCVLKTGCGFCVKCDPGCVCVSAQQEKQQLRTETWLFFFFYFYAKFHLYAYYLFLLSSVSLSLTTYKEKHLLCLQRSPTQQWVYVSSLVCHMYEESGNHISHLTIQGELHC